jgi:hypothetical protein
MGGLTQKQLIIALVVIAALLAGIVGILMWQNANNVPAVSDTSSSTDPGGASQIPQTNNSTGPAGGGEFDPATAPAVPAEETPEQYVNRYYQLCQDGDYATAYTLLPTATQAYYGDEAGFEQTLAGYGISGFSVQPQVEADGQISVVGVQQAQGMDFPYTWVFVQGDSGEWLVKAREMGGLQ